MALSVHLVATKHGGGGGGGWASISSHDVKEGDETQLGCFSDRDQRFGTEPAENMTRFEVFFKQRIRRR